MASHAEELQANRQAQYGAPNFFVYPFSVYPESDNPSGHLNFSKVSHAKLTAEVESTNVSNTNGVEWQMSVHAISYNWLVVKDGRALRTFA